MLLTTTENIPGKNYEILGLVKGNMIQTKNIGRDITQGLKSIVGGELKNYVKMMNESRSIATQRMVEEAEGLFRFHEQPNPDCPVGRNIHKALNPRLANAQKALEEELRCTTLAEIVEETRQAIQNESH